MQQRCRAPCDFYPRPPGGGRQLGFTTAMHLYGISIHALRVEGDTNTTNNLNKKFNISIHALRVEGDGISWVLLAPIENFYPRPPGGGRQQASICRVQIPRISIHALRVEGDVAADLMVAGEVCNFYPRPPGGGRQQKRTKFSSVFAQKGEEFASLRRGKRKFADGVLKRTNFGF